MNWPGTIRAPSVDCLSVRAMRQPPSLHCLLYAPQHTPNASSVFQGFWLDEQTFVVTPAGNEGLERFKHDTEGGVPPLGAGRGSDVGARGGAWRTNGHLSLLNRPRLALWETRGRMASALSNTCKLRSRRRRHPSANTGPSRRECTPAPRDLGRRVGLPGKEGMSAAAPANASGKGRR